MRSDGIYNFNDIKDRCVIEADTGCWLWGGSINGDGIPSIWYPALRRHPGPGVVLYHLTFGEVPPKGVFFHRKASCTNKRCMNPAHRQVGDRSSQMKAAKITRDAVVRMRISVARRRRSKLSDEDVAAIRASNETLVVLGERYGVHFDTVSKIRRGRSRRVSDVFTASLGQLIAA